MYECVYMYVLCTYVCRMVIEVRLFCVFITEITLARLPCTFDAMN